MRFGLVRPSLGPGIPVKEAIRTAYEAGALVFATGVSPAISSAT